MKERVKIRHRQIFEGGADLIPSCLHLAWKGTRLSGCFRSKKRGADRINLAVSRATTEKDKAIHMLQDALRTSRDILNLLVDILYKASEIFRRAVDAIILFGTEQHKSIFVPSVAAIKKVMQEYRATTEQQKAVGEWLCGTQTDL